MQRHGDNCAGFHHCVHDILSFFLTTGVCSGRGTRVGRLKNIPSRGVIVAVDVDFVGIVVSAEAVVVLRQVVVISVRISDGDNYQHTMIADKLVQRTPILFCGGKVPQQPCRNQCAQFGLVIIG